MSEAALQILLLLAYLAIGLISVTFPIYAISVTYLRQEKSETEKERKKRIEVLKSKIASLTAKLGRAHADSEQIAQLKEQIERYETEKADIEMKVNYLTAKGAVLHPVTILFVALLLVISGIHFYYEEARGYQQGFGLVVGIGVISAAICIGAIGRLYSTICAIESAALRPARSVDFIVMVKDDKENTLEKLKLKKETILSISAVSKEDSVENFQMFARFPSEFEILGKETDRTEDPTVSRFHNMTVLSLKEGFLPKRIETDITIMIIAKKVGVFPIGVTICGKEITDYEETFNMKVVI